MAPHGAKYSQRYVWVNDDDDDDDDSHLRVTVDKKRPSPRRSHFASKPVTTLYFGVFPDGNPCPYSVRALKILERKGYEVDVREIVIDRRRAEYRNLLDELYDQHGVQRLTFPQILIGDEYIGGHDDLVLHFRKSRAPRTYREDFAAASGDAVLDGLHEDSFSRPYETPLSFTETEESDEEEPKYQDEVHGDQLWRVYVPRREATRVQSSGATARPAFNLDASGATTEMRDYHRALDDPSSLSNEALQGIMSAIMFQDTVSAATQSVLDAEMAPFLGKTASALPAVRSDIDDMLTMVE